MKENKKFYIESKKEEPKLVESECQNCGKKVMIVVPFYGCVFCSECMEGQSYDAADASEFKSKFGSYFIKK